MLMFPRGALQVQCSLCGQLNDATQANQLGHVVCGGCQITLMYAHGAQSVKCAVCNHVTPAISRPSPSLPGSMYPQPSSNAQQPWGQTPFQPQQQQLAQAPYMPPQAQQPDLLQLPSQPQQQQPTQQVQQAVLVENPPTIDENGQEVVQSMLGLSTTKPDSTAPS